VIYFLTIQKIKSLSFYRLLEIIIRSINCR
jgi:hypothetical protein